MAASSLPTVMKAWQYTSTSNGLEKDLHLNSSAPLPQPASGQHLVKVIAAALNPVDYKPAEVPILHQIAIRKPATPGIDFVGRIVKPAADSALKEGQLVYGAAGTSPLAGGALREYAIAGIKQVAAVPEGLAPVDAATVGVAGMTAFQSIVPHVKKGDKIFINGGSGGTGMFGIQFAKAVGCHVTTSCSTPNVELCKSLGADEVIDYKKDNVTSALIAKEYKFAHAVDNVGSNTEIIWRSHEYLQPQGKLVIVGGEVTWAGVFDTIKRNLLPRFLGGIQGNVTGFWPTPKPEDLSQIGGWLKDGQVKAVIDEKYPFEEAPAAFTKLKTGRARGKIVVDVAPEST